MLTLASGGIFLCQLNFKANILFIGSVLEIDSVFDNPPTSNKVDPVQTNLL